MSEHIEEEEEDDGIAHLGAVPLNVDIEKKKKALRLRAEELRSLQEKYIPIIITKNGNVKEVTDLTNAERREEIIRCTLDPIYYIETYLTVFDQTQGDGGVIVPFKLFDFQKDIIRAFQTHRFNVANKYRQAGVSTTTSAYIAWYIAFNSNRNVAIVADKLETAKGEMMKDSVDFLQSCPEWLVPQPTKNTQKYKIYDNGCELQAFASNSLRGFTPTLLFWDEVAWAEKGDKFWKAAKPSLQTGGSAIFVSTPNSHDPVFYKTFDAARKRDGSSNFNAIELWWYNDPRYTRNQETGEFDLEWVKNKNKEGEIRIKDEHWSKAKRQQMVDDGWEATSSWFEYTVRDYNGDMRALAQEILCVFGDTLITVRNKITGEIEKLEIQEFYKKLEQENIS